MDAGLRFEDVKKVFESNLAFSSQSAAAKRINNALNYLHNSFPKAFSLFRNRTIVQSIVTLVCHLQRAGLKSAGEQLLTEFIEFFLSELRKQVELGQKATDQDFIEFQRTVNANVKTGARTRQSILLRQLFRKHPGFFSTVSQSAKITEGLETERERLASSIRDLVSSLNERYAAKHGSDLFKATNKTATALAGLEKPLPSLDDYKRFIEQMYFVFRESIGNRLNGSLPAAFSDINDLRTMLQHDVDHGKRGKAAKRRKELGAVFRTYSGLFSPDAVDPSGFALVQVNVLGALKTDLDNLAKSLL